jgi:hypothetical protein
MKPSAPNLPTRSELFDESRLTDDLTRKFYSKPHPLNEASMIAPFVAFGAQQFPEDPRVVSEPIAPRTHNVSC